MAEETFDQPPLVEVAFGIRFRPIQQLSSAHFGRYWASLGKDFPEAADQIPVIDPEAVLDGASQANFLDRRVWLLHKEKALLLQLQRDRFHLNWRRLQPTADYPRFTTLAPLFEKYASLWLEFLEEIRVGSPESLRCELSYVNHLPFGVGWTDLSGVGKLLIPLQSNIKSKRFAKPHGLGWTGIFDMGPCRISGDIKTLENRTDRQKLIQFELKAASLSEERDFKGVVKWMTLANKALVYSFLNMTTVFAQDKVWGRVSNRK